MLARGFEVRATTKQNENRKHHSAVLIKRLHTQSVVYTSGIYTSVAQAGGFTAVGIQLRDLTSEANAYASA